MFRSLRSCPPPKIGDGLLRECKDTVATLTKNLSAELSALSKQQAKALADAVFVTMTAVEALDMINGTAAIRRIYGGMGKAGWHSERCLRKGKGRISLALMNSAISLFAPK